MSRWLLLGLALLVGCLPILGPGEPGPAPPPPPPPPAPPPEPVPPPLPSPSFTGRWQNQALASGIADTLAPTDARWLEGPSGAPWLLVTRRDLSNLLFAPAGEGFQLAAELGSDGRRVTLAGSWLVIAGPRAVTVWRWPELSLLASWLLEGPPVLAFGECSGEGPPELLAGTRLYQLQAEGWQDVTPTDLVLPRTLSAVAWVDLNHDGWLDLVAGTVARPRSLDPPSRLWLGSGPCQFQPGAWTVPALVSTVLVLDGNRDGWEDLYLATFAENELWENQRGRLVLTAGRFLNDWFPVTTTGAAAVLDLEGDGWPDLYLSQDNLPDQVWRNIGGRFLDVGRRSGLVNPLNETLTSVAVAVTVRDGLPWLYLPTRRLPGISAPRDQYWVPVPEGRAP